MAELRDGRRRATVSSLENFFDVDAFKAELAVMDAEFHKDALMKACDEVLEIIELIDEPGFWDTNEKCPLVVISLGCL